MNCTVCGASQPTEDNFCHRCGATQRNSRLPVRRIAPPPPAMWRQAAPVVARGAALVAAGIVGEWLLRSATKRALTAPLAGRKTPKRQALARKQHGIPADGILAISETIIQRRVIIRR